MKIFLLILSLLLTACQSSQTPPAFNASEVKSLAEKLESYDYILLGELHNNTHHHLFRAELLSLIKKEKMSIGFEQLQYHQQRAVTEFFSKENQNIDDLEKILDWRWYSWDIYRPLFEVSYREGFHPIALNLNNSEKKDIMKKEKTYFNPRFLKQTGLGENLSKELKARLLKDIDEGHCRKLPKKVVSKLAFFQRARDAYMSWGF